MAAPRRSVGLLAIMIEFCTKKRMIAAIVILIGISVIVLVIENRFPIGNEFKNSLTRPHENSSEVECEAVHEIEVLAECRRCSTFEQKTMNYCKVTGYMEQIKCLSGANKGKEISRSCPQIAWVEERHFWIFEGCSLLVGFASYGIVFLRQRRLDRLLIEKVNRQIAAGV